MGFLPIFSFQLFILLRHGCIRHYKKPGKENIPPGNMINVSVFLMIAYWDAFFKGFHKFTSEGIHDVERVSVC